MKSPREIQQDLERKLAEKETDQNTLRNALQDISRKFDADSNEGLAVASLLELIAIFTAFEVNAAIQTCSGPMFTRLKTVALKAMAAAAGA